MTGSRAGRQTLRRFTRWSVETRAGRSALRALAPDCVAVFVWHSVGSTAAPFFDRRHIAEGVSSHCSLDAFASHIAWIRKSFRIVPLDAAIDTLQTGRSGQGWLAALTFDDGFMNVAEEAAPWLASRGLPCTMFINSALADRIWVKDDDIVNMAAQQALEGGRDTTAHDHPEPDVLLTRLGQSRADIARTTRAYASWADLRGLPPTVTFGNHGARHLRLSRVQAHEARIEIDDGRRDLEREMGIARVPYAFAYGQPSDITDDARLHAMSTHTAVLSAFGGCAVPGDREEPPRVPVFSSADPALLAEYTFPPRALVRLLRPR